MEHFGCYLVMMWMQHLIQAIVQENNFDIRLNYVSYGSYYLKALKACNYIYPRLKDTLKDAGNSFQGHDVILWELPLTREVNRQQAVMQRSQSFLRRA